MFGKSVTYNVTTANIKGFTYILGKLIDASIAVSLIGSAGILAAIVYTNVENRKNKSTKTK